MLYAIKPKSREITSLEKRGGSLYLESEYSSIALTPLSPEIVRVSVSMSGDCSDMPRPGIVGSPEQVDWEYRETASEIELSTGSLSLKIARSTGSFSWYDSCGSLLFREAEKDAVTLEKFTKYRMTEARTERVKTADGEKEVVREASRVPDGTSLHAAMYMKFSEGEALYGLGQHEEGFADLRSQTVYGHQANRKIAVPMLLSSLGYGILFDTYSPFIFSDTEPCAYFYSEAVPRLEYYFIFGGDMRGTVRGYRKITGKAAMLPKWAFGYIQSQERYETQDEIISVVEENRRRGIGLDCAVLDWCSWEDGKWGQKSFDKKRFPDPAGMIEKLQSEHTHFMISVWANSDPGGENHEEFKAAGLFLPGQNVYNALSEEGRKMYWSQLERGLYHYGIDAWWCDNSEPITPEWQRIERPERSQMYSDYCRGVFDHIPPEQSNAFGFYHALGVYEGQRSASDKKRVCNLTRSGYTGQQRLGTILWSGDISATWDTLTRQIASGLNFSASGLPYWTTDIGAFFVKRSVNWYWKGDFDGTVSDLGYRELFTRWYQWEAFLPIFRGHGTDCRRELWNFENAGGVRFYDAILKANRLRYELMPYIYSVAGSCYLGDGSMIENLAFGWQDDPEARRIGDQYMFGPSLMICPVHEPMYYLPGSVRADRPKSRKVYLPKTEGGWYDFFTGEHFERGGWIDIDAPIDKIPVFAKAGSAIPLCEPALSTEEQGDRVKIRVFPGAAGSFELYEDDGDGYGYEKGEYRLTRISASASGELSAAVLHDYKGSKVKYKIIDEKSGKDVT